MTSLKCFSRIFDSVTFAASTTRARRDAFASVIDFSAAM